MGSGFVLGFTNYLPVVDPYGYGVKSPFRTKASSVFPVILFQIDKMLPFFNITGHIQQLSAQSEATRIRTLIIMILLILNDFTFGS